MKQFVKALDKNENCFKYLSKKFPRISDAKIKEGIFVGPDIRKLIKDINFEKTVTSVEKDAWLGFKSVVDRFLGNKKHLQFRDIV